jgi:hypothetical protein
MHEYAYEILRVSLQSVVHKPNGFKHKQRVYYATRSLIYFRIGLARGFSLGLGVDWIDDDEPLRTRCEFFQSWSVSVEETSCTLTDCREGIWLSVNAYMLMSVSVMVGVCLSALR